MRISTSQNGLFWLIEYRIIFMQYIDQHLEFSGSARYSDKLSRRSDDSTQITLNRNSSQVNQQSNSGFFTYISFQNLSSIHPKSSLKNAKNKINGKDKMKKINAAYLSSLKRSSQKRPKQKPQDTLKDLIRKSQSQVLKSKNKQNPPQLHLLRQNQLSLELKQLHQKRKQWQSSLQKGNKQNNLSFKQSITERHEQSYSKLQTMPFSASNANSTDRNLQQSSSAFAAVVSKQTFVPKRQRKCFYTNLQNRLKRQIQKINNKNVASKINLIQNGCQTHSKVNNAIDFNQRSVTERKRPRTAGTRVGLEISRSEFALVRPKSSKSKNTQRRQLQYASQKVDEYFKEGKKKLSKSSSRSYGSKGQKQKTFLIPQATKTYRHINPIHKDISRTSNSRQLQLQKIKAKMLGILIDCQQYTEQYEHVQDGLKLFKSYAQKIKDGGKQKIKVLRQVQLTDLVQ